VRPNLIRAKFTLIAVESSLTPSKLMLITSE
jgi:hypothetical protein